MPDPAEVPHLSIQVVNFHRPLLGTFHQKALVVDRRVALLNSNNIQDRPNLEVRSAPSASTLSASLQLDRIDLALLLQMMVHLEGPIVDSLYDNMLISFDEPLKPTLPCLVEPSPSTHPHLFPYTFTDANPYLADIDVAKAARAARMLLQRQDSQAEKGEYTQSLDPPEWWRRDSASPSPWPFGALSHYHPSANLHPAQQPRVIRTDTDEPEGGRFAALVTQLVEKAREEKARLALGMSNVIGGAEHTSQPTTAAGAGAGAAGAPSQPLAVGPSPASHGTDAPRSSVADSGVEMSSKLSGEDGPPTNGHPVSPVLAEDTPTEGRQHAGSAAADGASLASRDVLLSITNLHHADIKVSGQLRWLERNRIRPVSTSRTRHPQLASRFPNRLLLARMGGPTRAPRLRRLPSLRTRMLRPTGMEMERVQLRVLGSRRFPRPSTLAPFPRSRPRSTTRISFVTSSRTCCTKRTNHSVESRTFWPPFTLRPPLTERTQCMQPSPS